MIKKLSSRKFWVLLTVLVTSALSLLNVDNETITKVTALITSASATVIYLLVQGSIDKKG
jgi:hypothetical protein